MEACSIKITHAEAIGIGAFALVCLVALATQLPRSRSSSRVSATETVAITGQASVIDGDTLEIRSERIRLFGIDAPESAQTCRKDGERWPCGRRAAFALSDKIGARNVSCTEKDRDRWKRIVAVCRIGSDDLSSWLVAEGWALAYRKYSFEYDDEEKTAKAQDKGIWSSEFVPPWDWRKRVRLEN